MLFEGLICSRNEFNYGSTLPSIPSAVSKPHPLPSLILLSSIREGSATWADRKKNVKLSP